MKAANIPATSTVQRSVVEYVNSGNGIGSYPEKSHRHGSSLLALGNACRGLEQRAMARQHGIFAFTFARPTFQRDNLIHQRERLDSTLVDLNVVLV